MKKETDKRLIIPKDAFEEEASEGLGRLNREEAAEDLRDLEGRMATQLHDLDRRRARRLRKHLRIWIPAAAAVTVILVASTVYIGLFRDRQSSAPETAMVEESRKDTVLIAMAAPITKAEDKAEAKAKDESGEGGVRYVAAVVAEEDAVSEVAVLAEEANAENEFKVEANVERVIEIMETEAVAEEVIVQAVAERSKAAEGIPARAGVKAEAKTEVEAKARTETRAAKDVAVADRQAEYISAVPDHGPRPAAGIEALNTWISSNIQSPSDVLHGTAYQVIVSFKVRADSTLYDLKAEQSPGYNFTEEAFRLLREGPKWEPAVRNGTPVDETVRVRLFFK